MFKGLKSRIAEETKRIQDVVVNQVGEGINNLTKRQQQDLYGIGSDSNEKNSSATTSTSTLVDVSSDHSEKYVTGEPSSIPDVFLSANNTSLSFNEMEGNRTPLRQRHDSNDSVSSFDNFFPTFASSPRMAVIPSDVETDVESVAGSSYSTTGASREQISSVLNKLQGRAANYKEKYRQLAAAYKSLMTENEKIRTIMTKSQDKALRRLQEMREERKMCDKDKRDMEENLRSKLLAQDSTIATLSHQIQLLKEDKPTGDDGLTEAHITPNHDAPAAVSSADKEKLKKLEDLLSRCKESIKSYKEKIQNLTVEKEQLAKKVEELQQDQGDAQGISDLVTERVVAEWKQKLKECEESWQRKLASANEENSLTLAQWKQEMHAEIERKEQTVQELRNVIKTNDSANAETISKLHGELSAAREAEKSFEKEKKELLQELSQSKQAAVKIVKDEEENKRKKLKAEFDQKLVELNKEFDVKLSKMNDEYAHKISEKEKAFASLLKERDEQMQLALEERDLQKMAALAQHDEKNDRLQAEIETLQTEKLQIKTLVDKLKEDNEKLQEMARTAEDELKNKYESKIAGIQKRFDQEVSKLQQLLNEKDSLIENLTKEHQSYDEFESKMKQHYESTINELRMRSEAIESDSNQKVAEMKTLLENLRHENTDLTKSLRLLEETSANTINELKTRIDANIDLNQKFSEMEKFVKTLQHENSNLTEELKSLGETSTNSINEFRVRMDANDSSSYEKILELEKLIENLKYENNNLTTNLQSLNETSANTINELRIRIESNDSDSNQRLAEAEKLIQENSNLMESLNSLKDLSANTINELRMEITGKDKDFHQKVSESEKLVENLKAENHSLSDSFKNVKHTSANTINDLRGELNVKETNINNLNASLHALQCDKDKLSENFKKLTDKLKDDATSRRVQEQKALDGCKQQITTLEGTIASLNERLSEKERTIEEMANENRRFKESEIKLKETHDEILVGMKKSLAEKYAENDALCKSDETFKIDIAKLEDNLRLLREELTEKCAALKEGDENLRKAEAKIESLDAKLAETAKSHAEFKEKRDDQEKREVHDVLKQRDELQKILNEKMSDSDVSAEKFRTLENEKEKLTETAKKLKALVKSKEADLSVQRQAVKESNLNQQRLNDEISRLKSDSGSSLTMFKTENKALKDAISRIERELNEKNRTINEKEDEIKASNAQIRSLSEQLSVINNTGQDLQRELAEKIQQISQVESCNQSYVENMSQLEKTIQQLRVEFDNSCQEKTQLSEKIIELEHELKAKEIHLNDLTEQCNAFTSQITSFSEQLDEANSKADDFCGQIAEKNELMEKLKNEKLNFEEKQTVMQKKTENAVKTLQSDNKKLTESVKDLEERLRDVDGRNKKLFSVSLDSSNPLFAEPTEAEYLRNIVFRYMVERETLGKESINLAKAIAAVLKLNLDQTKEILEKEELRLSNWFK